MKTSVALLVFAFLFIPFSHSQNLELELFASNLNRPVSIKHAGDDKLYVVEQHGSIRIVNADGTVNTTPFLDIDSKVGNLSGGNDERGFLGLAFHPDFSTNGYFFVNYINNSGDTVVSRFTRNTTDPLVADASSELIIITYYQPYSNHNGGDLAFDDDGYLYIASGDGGSGGDPQNNSQNTNSLLGKLMRLDINSTTATHNYTIPASNPFVGVPNFREEIWAYGLRNPWKFSFDRLNGDLWIADVGQNNYEEINHVSADDAATGLNYGWRCYEGNSPYNTSGCASASTYTYPISGYTHSGEGSYKCSITGGYRYRGSTFPNFNGWYFFADLCSQEIGYLVYNDNSDTWTKTFKQFSGQWAAFGEDVNGEIYISNLSGGKIYKLIDTTLSIEDELASKISIYPNPTKSILNINFGSNHTINNATDISIYDLHGKMVKFIHPNSERIQKINISDLTNGVYVLKIDSNNGEQSTHKLVIN